MEHCVWPVPGRTKPRWSRLFTGAAAQTAWSPASIAGLAAVHPAGTPTAVHSATVCVGPPLSWSPAGSSCGFVLLNDPFAVLKPQLVPSSRLWPPSVMAAGAIATGGAVGDDSVAEHGRSVAVADAAAAEVALLPEKVLLVTVSVPPVLTMPPPALLALLPEKVLLVTVSVPPSLKMPPPPPPALLPEKVLLVTVSVPPLLKMPPPTVAVRYCRRRCCW